MSELRISPEVSLPIDVAGEAIAILAKRGAGKTNTATVLVEELAAAGIQVVVLDPVGAWWGLRSSADGKAAGLAIPILGGQHGDVPLEHTAGAVIADAAVDHGASLLLDLSDFSSKEQMRRFVTDFAERLFRRKARDASLLHLVLEEADTFAPQNAGRRDDGRMQSTIEQIVRRGRSRGLGVTMVTQRSAVLSKDVLTQADVLVVMRTTGPQDVRAIKEWVASRGDDHAKEILDSLPSLDTGEAWIWNPERDLAARVHVRARATFDSSSTPKAGKRRAEPKDMAAIDLAALGAQIEATAEKAKANDPALLQQRVRELEKQLRDRPAGEPERVEVQVPVEVSVLDDEHVDVLQEIVGEIRDVAEAVSALRAIADQIESALRSATPKTEQTSLPASPRVIPKPRPVSRSLEGGDVEGEHVKAGARRIVETLARHYPMRVTRAQLGTLTGFKITGGTFQTYFSQLKRLGLIAETDGEISVTDEGIRFSGLQQPAPMTTEETLAMWRGALKAGARTMLDVLVERHPRSLSKDELADAVEMTVTGGTFQTYLSTLRRNGLITIDSGDVRASDTLFIGARS